MSDTKKPGKQPADHKPKKDVTQPSVLKVTVRDHEWTIDPAIMDDFELLEDMAEIDRRNATRFPSVMRRVLGDDQYRAALDLLRDDETGRVGVEAGTSFLLDLMAELDPNS